GGRAPPASTRPHGAAVELRGSRRTFVSAPVHRPADRAASYRLVVVDLDGTARSRRLGITPGVRRAIEAARSRGVRVCVATGRMWRSAEPWIGALGADPPAVLYNGGQVLGFGTMRPLLRRPLPSAAAPGPAALLPPRP